MTLLGDTYRHLPHFDVPNCTGPAWMRISFHELDRHHRHPNQCARSRSGTFSLGSFPFLKNHFEMGRYTGPDCWVSGTRLSIHIEELGQHTWLWANIFQGASDQDRLVKCFSHWDTGIPSYAHWTSTIRLCQSLNVNKIITYLYTTYVYNYLYIYIWLYIYEYLCTHTNKIFSLLVGLCTPRARP